MMQADLKSLKIQREPVRAGEPSPWARRWILTGVALFALAALSALVYRAWNQAPEVETVRVMAAAPAGNTAASTVILNATGYIVAAHKIQVASKVVGKVQWIGVDKGDRVREGQVLVRLEDDEYRAQLKQAEGQLAQLQARLRELEAGSRPEEIAAARANVEQAKAEADNARLHLERTRALFADRVMPKSLLDEAEARHLAAEARVRSLEQNYELVRIGPRQEQIDAARGQLLQAQGAVEFYRTQLNNTVIRAPVSGTILERVVERGEFVTTSFVGDRGAKGFVVSLADLNDLQVELDISQNDFSRLDRKQKAAIAVDAYPGRQWEGMIDEISPEANRAKATVQVKVKILNPDDDLRPEMNASVAFLAEPAQEAGAAAGRAVVFVPSAAVRNDRVFVFLDGRAVERAVRISGNTPQGLRVEEGLNGGEDLIVNPPPELTDGAKVRRKGS